MRSVVDRNVVMRRILVVIWEKGRKGEITLKKLFSKAGRK